MIELQTIFEKHGDRYRKSHALCLSQEKAMKAVRSCRTSTLGGHSDVCDSCGIIRISYNSCRNRNCPKCGNLKKEQWIQDRSAELLPVPYFHAVFTVPEELNVLFMANQAQMYNILFAAVSQTLIQLAKDKKHLGAQIGITTVLHTWGQNLGYHPHIHCIVPGGGISPSGLSFIRSRDKFFIPVKVLSRMFRGKLLEMTKTAWDEKKLRLDINFKALIDNLYRKEWVVYCKKPFRTSNQVVAYLGRYTHKTAIYNQRLIGMDDAGIRFRWRDYRDGKTKVMQLDAMEFIRRFMMHVLPSGFQRIRHYGLLSNRNRSTKLMRCLRLIHTTIQNRVRLTARELILQNTGIDITLCPHCGGHWVTYNTIHPRGG